MSEIDYLLDALKEESGEVIQAACKITKFGIDNFNPNTKIKNKAALETELRDLIVVMDMLYKKGVIDLDEIHHQELMQNKEQKILKYMKISKNVKGEELC